VELSIIFFFLGEFKTSEGYEHPARRHPFMNKACMFVAKWANSVSIVGE
jgi:hypothetical protein